MPRSIARLPLVLLTLASLSLAMLPADAAAKRTRPGGSRASASSSGRAAAPARVRGGAPSRSRATRVSGRATRGVPTRVSGRATYGYGYHGVYTRYRPYHYGFWSPWYFGYWGWGYPYYHWGYPYYWGYPGPGYRTVRVAGDVESQPAMLETDVRPRRSEVLVDGQFVGQARDFNGTWDRLFLEPGLRKIEFVKEGYKTLRLYMNLEPGHFYHLRERLEKGEGLDGRSMEAPPAEIDSGETEELPPARAPAGAEETGAPAAEAPAAAALAHGLLRIAATPRDAAVYLDGEFLARADELSRLHGALPVAPGRHVIEVVRPGYAAVTREIVVGRDEPARVEIDLERNR